ASWEQVWNPKWKTSLYGGWLAVMYDDNAKALIAAATCGPISGSNSALPATIGVGASAANLGGITTSMASGSLSNVQNCDPNWQIGYIGTRTQWNVTSQFYMGIDILYTKMYTGFKGLAVLRSTNERPSGIYSIEDQDNLAVTFRVHRDFVL
ncbi:MAG TPA: hypothetical protein VGH39_03195, partial [Xanthobacteraceae bacterium]